MVLALLAAASLGQMNAGDLRQLCLSSRADCHHYVAGVLDGVFLAARVAKDTRHFCLGPPMAPDDLTARIGQALEQDLARYPDDAKLSAVSLVAAFADDAFPCRP